MHFIDADPEHDRTFAEVAPLLEEWHTLQALRPSAIERAWSRAGFRLVYAPDLARHVAYWYDAGAVAFLPTWAASAHPIYRNIILLDIARRWEEAGYHAPLDALAEALAAEDGELGRDA